MSARRLRPSSRFDPPEFALVMCGSPDTTDGPAAATGFDEAGGCARRDEMPCGFPPAGSADARDGTRCPAVGGKRAADGNQADELISSPATSSGQPVRRNLETPVTP